MLTPITDTFSIDLEDISYYRLEIVATKKIDGKKIKCLYINFKGYPEEKRFADELAELLFAKIKEFEKLKQLAPVPSLPPLPQLPQQHTEWGDWSKTEWFDWSKKVIR